MPNNDSQESIRMALALGELSARVKSIEDRTAHSETNSLTVMAELRDEMKNNTEKFEKIIESLRELISDNRDAVSTKIENAIKKMEEANDDKYVDQVQFSKIESQLNGLTSKLTMIWSAIIFFGYAINWLIAHPGIITALGAK